MKNNFTCFLFLLLFLPFMSAQELITLEQVITYPSFEIENFAIQKGMLPRNIPGKQKVLLIEFSQEPFKIEKKDGNEIAIFRIQRSRKPTEIIIRSTILMHPYDFAHASLDKKLTATKKELKEFLQHENLFQVNHKKIKAKASEINGASEEEIVENIFDFVVEHMDYNIYNSQYRGAKKSLSSGKGDCTEYAELMVTLCRAKGIPARIVMGLVDLNYHKNPRHNWVEVYFEKYGWVPFDPTFADCGRENCPTTFEHLSGERIYFSYDRHTLLNKTNASIKSNTWLNVDYTFETKNILTENLRNALLLFFDNQYDESLVLLDSFINMGFHRLDYHQLKTKILCYQNRIEEANKSLLFLEKKSATQNEKSKYLFLKAIWYATRKDDNNTYATIEKWESSLKYKTHSYYKLKNEKAFLTISTQPEFKKLLQSKEATYYADLANIGSLRTDDPTCFGLSSMPSVYEIRHKYGYSTDQYLKQEVKSNNVKSIAVTDRLGVKQTFEFDQQGNLTQFLDRYSGKEYSYDALDRKISTLYFRHKDNKVTNPVRHYYEYDDKNLKRILVCKGDCDLANAILQYTFEFTTDQQWIINEMDENQQVIKQTTYKFDNNNRIKNIKGTFLQEAVGIDFQYDDKNLTLEKWLITQDTSINFESYRFDKSGNVISVENHLNHPLHTLLSIDYKYDRQGRLTSLSRSQLSDKDYYMDVTDSFFYNKKGLIKKMGNTFKGHKGSIKNKSKSELKYSYEFWK